MEKRHRIEIEFDSEEPESLYEMFKSMMQIIDGSPYAASHNIEVSMTPVFAHPQFCNPGCPANCAGREPT